MSAPQRESSVLVCVLAPMAPLLVVSLTIWVVLVNLPVEFPLPEEFTGGKPWRHGEERVLTPPRGPRLGISEIVLVLRVENANPTGYCEEVAELRYALLLDGRSTREAVGRTGERVALELEDDGQRVQVRIGLRYAEEDRACEVRIEGDPVVLRNPGEASRG